MNKTMEEKCVACKTKGILGYGKGKTYAAVAKDNKREETRSGQRENTNRIEMGSRA